MVEQLGLVLRRERLARVVNALMSVALPVAVYATPVPVAIPVPDLAGARDRLDRLVGRVTAAHPEVKVSITVVDRPVRQALVEAATGADLLVLGRSGRGAIERAALGSVSDHCLHHSPCPVALVATPVEVGR
ncbi:MAG TPA: universal stress protein [Acidimicrobiales bacterium]|nr:universal stress protein [Acidimicrobiales bacterium]